MIRQGADLPPGGAYLLFLSMVTRYHKGSLLAQPPMASVDAAAAAPRFAFRKTGRAQSLAAPTAAASGAEPLTRLSPERFCDDQ